MKNKTDLIQLFDNNYVTEIADLIIIIGFIVGYIVGKLSK